MIKKHPLTTRLLHWLCAILVLALFVSGWYMVELDYYSTWYQTLPELHILGGVLLMLFWLWVLVRLFTAKRIDFNQPHKPLEQMTAKWIKRLFYLLVLLMVSTGYLIATGQGEALIIFEQLKLPAISHFTSAQIDTMGLIHEYASYLLMVLVFFHTLGALKHHLIDKDDTLKRML